MKFLKAASLGPSDFPYLQIDTTVYVIYFVLTIITYYIYMIIYLFPISLYCFLLQQHQSIKPYIAESTVVSSVLIL